MIKVGNRDIGGIYVGTTPAQKAYIGSEVVWPSAKPLPYDYEVEYIQRDTSIAWIEDGQAHYGGFDISQYIPPGEMLQQASRCSVTWSFENNVNNITIGLLYRANAFLSLNMSKMNGKNTYSYTSSTIHSTSVVGDLEVYHEQGIIPMGSGNYQLVIDGALFKNITMTSTLAMTECRIMASSSGASVGGAIFRVKHVTFSDVADFIPVVKGSQIGFYNKIDGQLFLAEQACLSAGPRV